MDTFVARVWTEPSLCSPVPLADAVARVVAELPALNAAFRVETGSWCGPGGLSIEWAASVAVDTSCLIQYFATERGGVLLFGDTPVPDASGDQDRNAAARVVWQTHLRGGAAAIHQLDGCFAAVVFDAQAGSVEVCADLIGQRALRLAETSAGAFLSPHDACLVACGAASLCLDPVSLLSCLVVENSIQARSLLKDVQGLEGNDVLRFRPGAKLERARFKKLDFSNRIAARDVRAQQQCRDAAIEHIMHSVASWARSGRLLRCELTAGIDSRASLACLLGAGAASFVEAVTSGGQESVDMRTAKQLARLAGVKHSLLPAASDNTDAFRANATLRAFVTNGETDAKRTAKPLAPWDPDGAIRVDGSASEVFRGFFYPYMGPSGVAPDEPERLLELMLQRRLRRFAKVPLADEALRAQLRERLQSCFSEYFTLSSNGNDAIDMFYLFERCAHWGAQARRASWSAARNPLLVPTAVREAYRMPAPIGHWAGLHRELIRRYFPAGNRPLINGSRPLFFEGPGKLRSGARLGLTVLRSGIDKVNHRLNRGSRTQYAAQADLFAGALYPVVSELLTASNAASQYSLGHSGARRILEEHRTHKNHLALLGYAVTHEVYLEFLRRVRPVALASVTPTQ
jgi:hypothetical protein